ncbi:MAG TPA: molecular chaperone TorD family protein [Anaerolineales bacterium]
MSISVRADLYALLAEALAEPPDWMSQSGNEWPLTETVSRLTFEFEAVRRHLDIFACIPPEEHHIRQKRYTAIFASGKPRIWLYESAALTGRILGRQTFETARLYRSAGMETVGAELPDHVSVELAFLSHVAGSSLERQFLENHASWMIDLGSALASSGDEVYAPIGALLADCLRSAIAEFPTHEDRSNLRVPTLPRPDDCTLCGFCVQACPTPALKIVDAPKDILLVFEGTECIHCGKCEKICEFHALEMKPVNVDDAKAQEFRRSPHINCQKCGQSFASQAEMGYIVSQIGEAVWQNYCLDCRSFLFVR